MRGRALSLLLLSFLGLPSSTAFAQHHVLEPVLHLRSVSARDDLLVPIAFTGPGLVLGLRYGLDTDGGRFDADFEAGIAYIPNRFGHDAEQLSHGLSATYTHALDDTRTLSLGGALRWRNELSYLESWDDAHGYWLSTLTLGPVLRSAHAVSGAVQLEGRYELVLLGLASRPPVYRKNKQDELTLVSYHVDRLGHGTRVAAPWDLQMARAELTLRFRNATEPQGRGFGVGAQATFSRASDPEPYTLFTLGAVFGCGWEL